MPPVHIPEMAGRRWTEDGVELSYVSLSPLRMPLSAPLITWRLLRHAYAWHPDVIHVFKPIGHAGAAAWLHQLTHRFSPRPVPLVIDEDDWEGTGGWNETMPRSPVTRWLVGRQEGWALGNATAVTVASQALQSMAWSMRHDPANVHYLPNGPREWPAGDRETMRGHLGIGAAPVVLLYTRFFEYDVERVAETFRLIRVGSQTRGCSLSAGAGATAEARFTTLSSKGSTLWTRAGWIAETNCPAIRSGGPCIPLMTPSSTALLPCHGSALCRGAGWLMLSVNRRHAIVRPVYWCPPAHRRRWPTPPWKYSRTERWQIGSRGRRCKRCARATHGAPAPTSCRRSISTCWRKPATPRDDRHDRTGKRQVQRWIDSCPRSGSLY